MQWFINPYGVCLAFIPRSGSTTFARAILNQYYPELLPRLTNCHFPSGITEAAPQFICPSINTPGPNDTRIALIRDPIERFKSGFSRVSKGRSIQEVIDSLINKTEKVVNIHIAKQSNRIKYVDNIILYKFPIAIEAVANELGLIEIPPQENESSDGEKPDLSETQIAQLQQYYNEDIELYNKAFSSYDKLANLPIQEQQSNLSV